ncbi:MAG: YdcF family protein [Patescibacteria group bacterium]
MLLIKQQFNKLYVLLLKDKTQLSDVIIWLQGDRYDRGHKVLKLYKEGCARKIIISGNNVLIGDKPRVGETNVSLDEMKDFLLKKGINEKYIIVDDGAMNTKEQAEHIFKMANSKKWLKLILVGSSYYQPRAFLTFLKQAHVAKWNGEIINQSNLVAWNKKPSGRDKTAKIIFEEEFEKIKKYKKDLISVSQGIKYLNTKNV